ncbi:rCG57844 [Rattus norvegicus]|uniref:RCG57844 n=1 Tax=Rattus norvegicus TaxID=10116 RepID=A6J4I7_RAT|nr:rCG57844 [Rattus norvegicus]
MENPLWTQADFMEAKVTHNTSLIRDFCLERRTTQAPAHPSKNPRVGNDNYYVYYFTCKTVKFRLC